MNDTDWRPAATQGTLRARASLLAEVRSFFAARDVLEVETPRLSAAANTDPQLESLAVPGRGRGTARWLHTSPEFPMKRLLAAGSGAIYQVCHVFRGGEAGRLHNPEFTLLEWYRPGFDHLRLMTEVGELVTGVLAPDGPAAAPQHMTYRQAFMTHAGIDPFRAEPDELNAALQRSGLGQGTGELDFDQRLDLLMGAVVGPRLGRDSLCFITDYPASQAALARIRRGSPDVAERFELYWQGVELANGYHELTDAAEQQQRFEAENRRRRELGRPALPPDGRLLQALRQGLPPCAGVALGLDRLLMLKLGLERLEETLAFPWSSA